MKLFKTLFVVFSVAGLALAIAGCGSSSSDDAAPMNVKPATADGPKPDGAAPAAGGGPGTAGTQDTHA